MKLTNHASAALLLAGLALSTSASAGLFTRPGGMVYDTGFGITWTQDANLFQTMAASDPGLVGKIAAVTPTYNDAYWGMQTIDAGDFNTATGAMTWWGALAWVDYLNSVSYAGVTGWRLPTADPSCGSDANCTGSELGHLFYSELGAAAGDSILDGTTTELAKFTNIQSNMYWSGTEHAVGPSFAWDFSTHYGNQHYLDKGYSLYAWAVRSGDIAAVPEPESLMLLGSGVAAWMGGGWKRRRG